LRHNIFDDYSSAGNILDIPDIESFSIQPSITGGSHLPSFLLLRLLWVMNSEHLVSLF
jgi:hypothetical protein